MVDHYDLEALEIMSDKELKDSLYDMLIKYRMAKIQIEHLETIIKNKTSKECVCGVN